MNGPVLPDKSVARRLTSSPLGRGVLLWAGLIVLFLVIWRFLEPAPEGPVRQPTPGESAEFWKATAFSTLPMAAMMAMLGGVAYWASRRLRTYNAANAAALAALGEGDYARAAVEYERLAKHYRFPRSLHTMANFNLAIARMHAGDLADAIERLVAIERRATRVPGMGASLACQIAMAYALRGEIDAARRWRQEADKRGKSFGGSPLVAGLVAYVDALLDAREGNHEALIRWLDGRWRELDGNLTARTSRPLRVVRAFSLERSRAAKAAVDEALAYVRPARQGEFAMIGAEWSEMRAFLEAHGLG